MQEGPPPETRAKASMGLVIRTQAVQHAPRHASRTRSAVCRTVGDNIQ